MSHTIEVCFKIDATLEEVRVNVERVLGVQLPHHEASSDHVRSYYGNLLTIDLELSVNYLETDRELNFSDFQYVLGTRVGAQACGNRLRELQLPLADVIGLLLCQHLGTEVMITIDAQRLHARYYPERLETKT